MLRGQAYGYDEAAQTIRFTTRDGVERVLRTADLDRLSAYKIAKTRAAKGDARGQIRVGNLAREIECYAYAARHYDDAERADRSLKAEIDAERAENRRQAAAYCMRNAKEAVAEGDYDAAEKWLTKLVQKLPDETEAVQAAELLEQYHARNHEARDDDYEERYVHVLEKELKAGKKHYDAMLEQTRKGLANTRNASSARRSFEGAWKEGERALKELDKAQKKRGEDESGLAELFDGYRALVREHMAEAQSHLASLYTTTSDYRGALAAVNKALSIDPRNASLLAQRARIEVAASEGLFRW